jgi:hypothetical protein
MFKAPRSLRFTKTHGEDRKEAAEILLNYEEWEKELDYPERCVIHACVEIINWCCFVEGKARRFKIAREELRKAEKACTKSRYAIVLKAQIQETERMLRESERDLKAMDA